LIWVSLRLVMSAEHHYERPIVLDITYKRYWEKEEQIALAALAIAQTRLAEIPREQLVIEFPDQPKKLL
jgi:hypothetical protein